MKVQIGKWGNSLAVRLPRDLVERFGLKEGGEIDTADIERGLQAERDQDRERQRRQALKEIGGTRLHLPPDWKMSRDDMNSRPAMDRW